MKYDISRHPYFEKWTDPESGIASYLLKERIAPLQQSFYFTNSSVSEDGEYLWFYAAFPPSPSKCLAVVGLNPDKPFIKHFPNSQFSDASPLIGGQGEFIYYTIGNCIMKLNIEGTIEKISELSNDFIGNRRTQNLATHLTLSADKKYFLLDGEVGNQWFVGLCEIATGEIKILHTFFRKYNHAQFSKTNPNLFMIDQDWWYDAYSGRHGNFDQRVWLMDTQKKRFEPLNPERWFAHNSETCHDWWSDDDMVCFVDYSEGVYECDINTRAITLVWKGPSCHAHTNKDRTLWCADHWPYYWEKRPCEVWFFNRNTGKEIPIASALPQPPYHRRQYHIDPHPQFTHGGKMITYTTTVKGTVDVAFCPVEQLVNATK